MNKLILSTKLDHDFRAQLKANALAGTLGERQLDADNLTLVRIANTVDKITFLAPFELGIDDLVLFKHFPELRVFWRTTGFDRYEYARFIPDDQTPYAPESADFLARFHELARAIQVGYRLTYEDSSNEWCLITISSAPKEEVWSADCSIPAFCVAEALEELAKGGVFGKFKEQLGEFETLEF